MRNLKRVLSLALAMIMVLGLMVISSSAAGAKDFVDADEITYTEAVAVMSGLDIIEGDGNGTFNPNGILTREGAAKIICYMLMGSTNAEKLVGSEIFSDVPASRWSSKYVAYCANLGIIAGNGDGTFNPNGKLTGVAFAKLLLVALGNDPEENGYVGNNWATNVAVDAIKAGLDLDGVALYDPLTREQGCAMALKALNYSEDGASAAFVVTNGEGVVVYRGTDALTALALSAIDGNELTTSTTNVGSLGYEIFGLTEDSATDEFGRVSKTYTNGKDGKNEVVYASINPSVVLTYTTETKVSTIAAALGATASKTVTLNIIEDGNEGGSITANKSGDTAETEKEVSIGGQGTLIEVYKNGEAYDVIVINTYVTQLGEDDIVAAQKATATTDAVDAYIVLDAELTYKTDAFAEDDVVLYTKGVNTTKSEAVVVDVVKADYVTGAVTAIGASNAYVRVDGVQYKAAANANDSAAISSLELSTEYTFYLDLSGNIIFAAEGADESEPDYSYVYVIATAAKAAGEDGENLFDTTSGTAAAAQAQVIDLATGEIKVVNQGIVKTSSGYYYAKANGSADTSKAVTDQKASDGTVNAIMKYVELSDGSYVLAAATSTEVTLKKGIAAISDDYTATSSTVATVVTLEKDEDGDITSASVTTYTGIANFPSNELTADAAVVIANRSGIVSKVLIVKDAEPEEEALTYAAYAGEGETVLDADGNEVTLYAFYYNGEKVEYYSDADTIGETEKGDVVTLTVKDDTVTEVKTVEFGVEETTVTYVDATFFIAGGKVYYFNDTVVYDEGDSYAVASVAVKDVVSIVTGTSKAGTTTADFVLIAK